MQLPNGDRAIVPLEKLTEYALNPQHPTGRHKARVFARALGVTAENAELLHSALLRAAATSGATPSESDEHGQRYQLDFEMTTDIGTAWVRSAWIIPTGEELPRLLTCYIL
ncbi:MAG: DUF6883 domain-containing protein [Phycisphaerales bacterium JB039]